MTRKEQIKSAYYLTYGECYSTIRRTNLKTALLNTPGCLCIMKP